MANRRWVRVLLLVPASCLALLFGLYASTDRDPGFGEEQAAAPLAAGTFDGGHYTLWGAAQE